MNSYSVLGQCCAAGKPAALAVILKAEGSAPQEAGASAVFSGQGLVFGTVGGGILEAVVEKKAKQALRSKQPIAFDLRLEEDVSAEEGALCGGKVKVLIDPTPAKDRKAWLSMKRTLAEREKGLLATLLLPIKNGKTTVRRFWLSANTAAGLRPPAPLRAFRKDLHASWRDRRIRFVESPPASLFLEPQAPLPRLIIAGAGHIGQAVCRLGRMLDFEATVIDDRPEYANRQRFPEADKIVVRDIGRAVRETALGADAYLVIVTRGHARDSEALRAAIRRRAAYIGLIGSRRKVRLMRRLFLKRGWATSGQWSKVHSPIGLPIGSRTVAEIAVSIAAELVKVRREKTP